MSSSLAVRARWRSGWQNSQKRQAASLKLNLIYDMWEVAKTQPLQPVCSLTTRHRSLLYSDAQSEELYNLIVRKAAGNYLPPRGSSHSHWTVISQTGYNYWLD
eukprot:7329565-Pyramimonas_sp.AAC.1